MSNRLLNPGVYGNFIRWFGRVEKSDSWQNNIEGQHFNKFNQQKGWGYRYRVRVLGYHTEDETILPPDQCIMANVVLPVTSGSGLGGFHETPSLSSGSLVTGFFVDGEAGQEAFIDGVLINSNNNVPKSIKGSRFELFNDTYNYNAKVPDFLIINKDT